MTNKYLCPCCGKTQVDDMHDSICDYCGWDDVMQDRGDADDENSGVNRVTLNQAKSLVQQGKNVFGGPLPYYGPQIR